MSHDKDPIDPLLNRWTQVPRAPELKAEIWRRIAVAEAEQDAPGFWDKLEAAFRRPSFSFTFVLACMLAGLFVAEMRLTQLHQQRSTQFAHSYVQLIDPLLSSSSFNSSLSQEKP